MSDEEQMSDGYAVAYAVELLTEIKDTGQTTSRWVTDEYAAELAEVVGVLTSLKESFDYFDTLKQENVVLVEDTEE